MQGARWNCQSSRRRLAREAAVVFLPGKGITILAFFFSSFPASPGVGVNGARKRHYSRPLNIWDWVPRLYNRPRWLKNFLPCIYHLQRVPRVNVAPLVVRVWAFLRACACVGDRVCPWECVKVCVCPRAHACVRALSDRCARVCACV